MNVSTEVTRQWASRPDDQRFLTMEDLSAAVLDRRDRSTEIGAALEHVEFHSDNETVFMVNPKTKQKAAFTNWSFGQVSKLVKAPAKYLRGLPPQLAALNLQVSTELADRSDLRLLQSETDEGPVMRAVHSSTYGRIWDSQVARLLMKNLDLSVWKVPSASYASSNPKLATTLYASDRDMFVFLVNEDTPIEVKGNNGRDTLFRGMIVGNSETGAQTLFFKQFLYRYVCDNRMIWGMQDSHEVKIKHTSGAPVRFVSEMRPALQSYLGESQTETVKVIEAARTFEIGKSHKETAAWLTSENKTAFPKAVANAVVEAAEVEEGNPRALWNLIQGATSLAKEKKHTDQRLKLETAASDLMKYAVARV